MSFEPEIERQKWKFEAVLKYDGEVQARVFAKTMESLQEELYKLETAQKMLEEE